MPNVDYRQFVDRFQSIERRLRNIELRPNPQLAVATGKTLTVDHSMTLTGADGFTLTIPETGTAVLVAATQTLTNKTLTTPTIGDFSNAQHSHADAAGGGQLSLTAAVSGILPAANGGTGVNNATRTLTINTNSGTLAFSGAGYTLTVPKTGTVPVGTGTAGRIAEWVTDANTVQASTLAKTGAGVLTLAAAANYTLTVPATGTAALLGTANAFTANQTVSGQMSINRNGNQIALNSGSGVAFAALEGILDDTTGGAFVFKPKSTTGLFTDRMRLLANGNVLIGTTTDSGGKLQVNQASSTDATPTLRLRQADLSEEFIRFDTTVGAGNPINTTALGAYYGRVRVWVEGVGAKWLALYD